MQSYCLLFKPSLLEDFENIYRSISQFSGSIEEARYVLVAIKDSIFQLENPYLPDSIPYSKQIAEKGFRQYLTLNGIYVVFFKEYSKTK